MSGSAEVFSGDQPCIWSKYQTFRGVTPSPLPRNETDCEILDSVCIRVMIVLKDFSALKCCEVFNVYLTMRRFYKTRVFFFSRKQSTGLQVWWFPVSWLWCFGKIHENVSDETVAFINSRAKVAANLIYTPP
jgi:hypothetical protein